MTIALYVVAAYFLVDTICTVGMTGRSITIRPTDAVVTVITHAALAAIVILAAVRFG